MSTNGTPLLAFTERDRFVTAWQNKRGHAGTSLICIVIGATCGLRFHSGERRLARKADPDTFAAKIANGLPFAVIASSEITRSKRLDARDNILIKALESRATLARGRIATESPPRRSRVAPAPAARVQ